MPLLAIALVTAGAAASQRETAAGRDDAEERRHLVVSGEIGHDDTVTLDPFLIVPARAEAPAPPAGNEYAVDLLAGDGEVVSSVAFGLSFREEAFHQEGARVIEIDVTPFAVTVDLPEGVQSVRLRRGDRVLVERTRTPNSPVVAITGARRRDGKIEVRWTGRDGDGDPLTYSLAYAPDGAGYAPVALDLPGDAYRFDPAPLGEPVPGRARVRVVASDGFNTGEASFPLE